MDRETKKTRWSRAKLRKCMNGAISVLLCLLLTPFLSVTLALIEYARYQEVMEIADELMELAELCALADYDKYIHGRFGLLAVSQNGALGNGLEAILADNAKITGNQLVPSSVSVTGQFPLQDTSVLQQQLLDFSQFTVPTAILMEDLDLQQLLRKLDSLRGVAQFTETVDSLADATQAVTEAVNKLETLKSKLTTLAETIPAARNKAADLANKFADLVKRLGDEGITLPSGASFDEVQAAVQDFMDSGCLDQIKEIYMGAEELRASLTTIRNAATEAKVAADEARVAISNAANAIRNIGRGGGEDADPSLVGELASTGTTVDSVVQEMQEVVNETLTNTVETVRAEMETAANRIIDTILNQSGLSDVMSRYDAIRYGSYFSIDDETLTVSDAARQDIIDFIRMAQGVYNSYRAGDGSVSADQIRQYFEGRFMITNASVDLNALRDEVGRIVTEAASNIQGHMELNLSSLIEKLGNLARKILDFNLFADYRLSSNVGLYGDSNGAEDFLNAIEALLSAMNEFKNKLLSADFIGMLRALVNFLRAIKNIFAAIITQVSDILRAIGELGGGWGNVADRLLISGYMAHSLPCRTDAGDTDGSLVKLKGESITGYSYNDIPRERDKTFIGAELEYVYKGTHSEVANQTLTFWDIYFLRLLIDLPSVFMDGEVTSLAGAATVAAWVVYIIYILAEPLVDTILLVNGAKVPFIKTKCWLTPTGMLQLGDRLLDSITQCDDIKEAANDMLREFSSSIQSDGVGGSMGLLDMEYRNYLHIMLTIFVSTEDQLLHLGNLINQETGQYYTNKGKTFNIAQTYTVLNLSADMTFNPFVDMGLLAGDGPLNLSGRMTRTVSY